MFARILTRTLHLVAVLVAVGISSACNHKDPTDPQGPEQQDPVPVTLQFVISSDFIDLDATRSGLRSDLQDYSLTYRCMIYQGTEPKSADKPFAEFSDAAADSGFSARTELIPGQYTLLAWASYRSEMTAFWETGDFDHISYRHPASFDDGSLAFLCRETLTVREDTEGFSFTMVPPMARLSIVASDREAIPVDLSNFRTRIQYLQYYPTAFSLFSNEPVDSEANVHFDCSFLPLSGSDDVEIGADYILVNGHETSIPLRFEVLNDAGEVLTSYDVTAPLLRGRQTTIRGNFFTGKSSSGTTIDPSFDGEDYFVEF